MRKIITGIIIFCLATLGGYWLGIKFKSPSPAPTLMPTVPAETGLEKAVAGALADSKGVYSVVITNFKTGERFAFLENRPFEAGSLYKLWVMAVAFEQIANGVLAEDEDLTASVAELNDFFQIATESAELTEGTVNLTVKSALRQMIVISHNYAALLLTKKIGSLPVRQFLVKNDLSRSVFADLSITTAADTALFFEKLYRGELGTVENTGKMLDLLKKQQLNDKLPKYLPESVTVAHKTGEVGNFTHDAGIVFGPSGNYLIVVLSESDSPYGAEERISAISKAVYDYFNP